MQSDPLPVLLQPSDPRWISFLDSCPDAVIFHHPAWSQLMSECYGYQPVVLAQMDFGDCVTTAIPLMELNSPINGKRWVSLPFSDHCTPLCNDPAPLQKLTEDLILLARQRSIANIELRARYPALPGLRFSSEHVIHKMDLTQGIGKVYDRIHKMHRRNLKTAQGSDITTSISAGMDGLKEFYRLHVRTRRYQGVPVQPWKFFESLQRLLIGSGRGFVLLAYQGHDCIAGAVFLHWKRTIMYKFGASDRNSLKYKPNDLIMWTALQWACANGYEWFDMGRTDVQNTGLRTFKSRWGAVEEPLDYSIISSKPSRPSNVKLRHLMGLVIRNSPVWVCRLSGELLYRHFG